MNYSRPGNLLLILDSTVGGSGPSANETTQTASGQGKNFGGGGAQNVESGAIGVGKNGRYVEQGGVGSARDLSTAAFGNAKFTLGKGATLNVTQPAASPLSGMSTSQPIASTSGPPPTSPPADPNAPATPATPADGTTPSTSTSTSLWQTIVDHWNAWTTWQKVGVGAAAALIVWLVFMPRRKS